MATQTPKPMVLDGHDYREMTESELAQRILDEADEAKIVAAISAKQVAREALLTKLGITADEAQLLLGA
jgi:hypothetical protein